MIALDVWVMLKPATAYPYLMRLPINGGAWLMIRRPLLFAFVFGCAVSLMTSGRLTLRLLIPAMVYWSFVPLLGIGSLAALSRRSARKRPLARTVDLFFMGFAPWSLWVIGFSAMWAFAPAIRVFGWGAWKWTWYSLAFLAMAWSGYIDFCFFRCVLERTPASAVRDLFLQRLICWAAALIVFLGSSAGSVVAPRLGL